MVVEHATARRAKARGFVSALAMALALGTGSMIAVAALSTPAMAADKDKDKAKAADPAKPTYSDAFVKAYDPIKKQYDKITDPAGYEPLRPMVAPMVATVATNDDKLVAGQFLLQLGLKLKDPTIQRQALMFQLDSGKTPAAQLGQFNYFVGSLSWDLKDTENTRVYLTKAMELGQRDEGIERLIGESYFAEDRFVEGLTVLDGMAKARKAAGSSLPNDTLRRALGIARDEGLADQIPVWTENLVRHVPNADNWNVSMAVLVQSFDFTSQEQLDFFRLLKRVGGLKSGRDYVDYVEAADVRRMSNEVLPLLEEAVALKLLDGEDVFVKEALANARERMGADRSDAASLAADARKATTALSARSAGDNFLSFGAMAEAEDMYKLALERDPADADRLNMRIGITQADQGKSAEANASFAKVGGNRAPIARMWMAYVDEKAGS